MRITASPEPESRDHDRRQRVVDNRTVIGIGIGTIPVERGKEIGWFVLLEMSYPLVCLRVIPAPPPEKRVVVLLQIMESLRELEVQDVPGRRALSDGPRLVGLRC